MSRFINADTYAATGQGLLGNNMLAYCLNNPICYSDPIGESGTAEVVIEGLLALSLIDGPIPIGDVIAIIGLIGLFAYEQLETSNTTYSISPSSIDWSAGDKNHILKGTKRSHISGWGRFGIDPDNSNAWMLVLPILKDVVENADSVVSTVLPDGAMIVQYYKLYADQGVQVMVKIWVGAHGMLRQLSDAIPYIVGE